jgi:hypothetical protein
MGKKKATTLVSDEGELGWRVHTPNLLKEIARNNESSSILSIPIQVFGNLLFAVGERASQLNDPELNALMARLTIYSVADPQSPDYNADILHDLLEMKEKKV